MLAVVAAALVAGAIAYGAYRLDDRHQQAMTRLAGPWRTMDDTLERFHVAAGDVRAGCLAGGPQGAAMRTVAGQHLTADASLLQAATTRRAPMAAAATTLDTTTAQWLRAVNSEPASDAMRLCAMSQTAEVAVAGLAHGASSPTVVDAGGYAAVEAAANRFDAILQARITRDADAAEHYAFASLLYVLAVCVGLLILAGVGAVVVMRRIVLPVSQIAGQLTRAGEPLAEQAPAAPRGWIASLNHASVQARATLADTQRKQRRGTEALAQIGPVVQGLHEVLTAHARPGPDVAVAADLGSAEGLIAGDYLGAMATGGATAVFLGDVSGHGVAAGLLAVQLKSVIDAALRAGLSPLAATRAAMHAADSQQERFTTLVVAVIDPAADTLTYVNAGHEEPYLLRHDGSIERLGATGPLIHPALDAATLEWTARTTPFLPGELLVLCTDGLVEARNSAGDELGEARVAATLAGLTDRDPGHALGALRAMAGEFGIDWRRDDITIMTVARTDAAASPGSGDEI